MRAKAASINRTDSEREPSARTFSIGGNILTAPKPVPGPHLVGAPLGNLRDITLRALKNPPRGDIIPREENPLTPKPTERHPITTELKTYHQHNTPLGRP